jgi:hypothetical protein
MKIKWEFITNFNAAHLFHWSSITIEHNLRSHYEFIPSWHKLGEKSHGRNWDVPFTTNHEQPFPVYYHCGIVDFELWVLGFPSSVRPHPFLCCVYRCDFYHGCPFDNFPTPCTIFWHDALSLRDHHTPLLIGCEFPRGTTFDNKYRITLRRTKFAMSLPLHTNLSPEQHLADCCTICRMLTLLPVIPPYRRIKCLIDTIVCRMGNCVCMFCIHNFNYWDCKFILRRRNYVF